MPYVATGSDGVYRGVITYDRGEPHELLVVLTGDEDTIADIAADFAVLASPDDARHYDWTVARDCSR